MEYRIADCDFEKEKPVALFIDKVLKSSSRWDITHSIRIRQRPNNLEGVFAFGVHS